MRNKLLKTYRLVEAGNKHDPLVGLSRMQGAFGHNRNITRFRLVPFFTLTVEEARIALDNEDLIAPVMPMDFLRNHLLMHHHHGPEAALFSPGLIADGLNWVSGSAPTEPIEANVKIRYKATEMPATLIPQGDKTQVWFAEPQRAITPGQAAVFYRGEELLGGGYISGPLTSNDAPTQTPPVSVPS